MSEIEALRELRDAVLHVLGGATCSCDTSVGHVCEPCHLAQIAHKARRAGQCQECARLRMILRDRFDYEEIERDGVPVCPECGVCHRVDEDGCCLTCGRDVMS